MPAGSSIALWQFPPKDKNTYPVSEESQQTISSAIDALDVEQATKSDLQQKLTDLRITGPTAGELKTAIDATSASSDARSRSSRTASTPSSSSRRTALSNLQALYGDLGLTSDDKTVFVAAFSGYHLRARHARPATRAGSATPAPRSSAASPSMATRSTSGNKDNRV